MTAPAPTKYRARIRMYRQGIGDSFLLSFRNGAQDEHVLIDCGVLVGTPNGKQWANDIADDVASVTAAGRLRAVVGTHPHWDHLSGFLDAKPKFQALTNRIDEVWMGWPENPKDPKGRAVKATSAALTSALQTALVRLAGAGAGDEATRARGSSISEVAAFLGVDPDEGLPLAAAAGGKTQDAVDALRALSSTIKYLDPGDVLTPSTLPNVRIYVLGPPRDEKLLGKMLSTRPGDMYELDADGGFLTALSGTAPDERADNLSPFQNRLLFAPDSTAHFKELADVKARYANPDDAWRRIDGQWLLSAEAIALQLDKVVNNLSVVLAFEFMDSGDVLLFPADAQVGNWLSWQSLEWTIKESGKADRKVRSKDLLARTVFYKVGHHGSHNATLENGGLEDMNHAGLTAAIPVNEKFARNSKHWKMPADKLYKRLQERTEGRLLRSDGAGAYATDPAATPVQNAEWQKFSGRVFLHPTRPELAVDYYVV